MLPCSRCSKTLAEFVMYFVEEKEGGGWDRSKWMEDAKPAIKKANALANLPYVKTEDGTVITQSNVGLARLALNASTVYLPCAVALLPTSRT